MKKIVSVMHMLVVVLLTSVLVSCSNECDVIVSGDDYARSMYGNYPITVVTDVNAETGTLKSGFDLNSLPVLDKDEILSLLKKMDGLMVDDTDKTNEVYSNGAISYTLSSTAGISGSNGLAVEMDFIEYTDNNSLYYKNNRLMATGDDMYILGKGFSLSTVDGHYKVVVSGTVYFRMVGDDDNPVVVSVPVELVGELDVTNDSCIYTCYVK